MTKAEQIACDILIEQGIVSKEELSETAEKLKSAKQGLYETLLVIRKLTDEGVGEKLGKAFGVVFADLTKETIEEGVFHMIPQVVAESQGVVAFGRQEEGVRVGMLDPRDLEMKHFVEKRLGEPIVPVLITLRGLAKALTQYEGSLAESFKHLHQRIKDPTLSREERDGATVELVDTIVHYGYANRGSDVHIEPFAKKNSCTFSH